MFGRRKLSPTQAPTPTVEILAINHEGSRRRVTAWKMGEHWVADFHSDGRERVGRDLDGCFSGFIIRPHGKVSHAPDFVKGWEPLDPKDFQPENAQSSHERIAELERQVRDLECRLSKANERRRMARKSLDCAHDALSGSY